MARRPEPIRLAGAIVSVMRGPDDTGRWYWRARRRGANNRTTLWTGWGTREEVAASLEGREMSAAKAQNGPNTMYTLLVSHAAKGGGDLAEMMRLSGYNHTPVSQPVSPRRWVEILRAFPSLTWEDLRTAELQMREGMTAADARRIAQEERGGTGMRRLDEVALGTAIRNKRTALGWTQAKLANASGGRTITASYVSNIERFKPQQLTNKRIAALERALGLPDGSLPRIPDGKASKALERVEAAAEVKAPEVLPELPELPETAPTITMTINIGGTVFKIEGPLAGMAGFLAQYQKRVGA